MSWTQARYKVELQMLYQSGRRNKVYLASSLYKPQVLRTTEQASFRQGLIVIDIQVRTALDRFSESPYQQIK